MFFFTKCKRYLPFVNFVKQCELCINSSTLAFSNVVNWWWKSWWNC